jgi:hypothetical protein
LPKYFLKLHRENRASRVRIVHKDARATRYLHMRWGPLVQAASFRGGDEVQERFPKVHLTKVLDALDAAQLGAEPALQTPVQGLF